MLLRLLPLLLGLCLSPAGLLRGQELPDLSPEARVSLVTILPGDQIYSQFGHSALRVRDPLTGLDRLYNYGTFDFDDPLFVPKFIRGLLDYRLSVDARFDLLMHHYAAVEERSSIEQTLNLTPAQRQALFAFLEWNYRPENRYYRYDFFLDNCSTRPRDALERALGPALRFGDEPDPRLSFRQLIQPYIRDASITAFGMNLGLGQPADRIASARETMFLPDYLLRAVDGAQVVVDGRIEPLVARTDTLYWVDEPDPAVPWASILLWTLFALALFRTLAAHRLGLPVGRGTRIQDAVVFGAAGVAGLVLLFLWLGTEHRVTAPNWNLLWAWPTHAVAAWWIVRRPHDPRLRGYLIAAGVVTLLVAAGWPLWPQQLPVPALPLLLLLSLRALWLAHAGRRAVSLTGG